MKVSYILPIVLVSSLLSSCSCDDKRGAGAHTGGVHIEDVNADVDPPKVELHIVRLEDELMKARSAQDLAAFDKKYPFYITQFIGFDPADPRKGELFTQMASLYNDPVMKEYLAVTAKKYNDIKPMEEQLSQMFSYIKFYYPDFKIPKVYTTIAKHDDYDLYLKGDLLIINLGFFLGKDVDPKYRVQVTPDRPQYIIDHLDPEYLMSTICQGYSLEYNKEGSETRMLETLIFYGKMHYFTERIMPDLPDSLNIMYTSLQMEEAVSNDYLIYSYFINKNLFYETNNFTIKKYTDERPRVQEIGDKCPGRIGRWLGWQIVRKYMKEHPEVTLQQLMADKDAQKIFTQSKYKPKK